MKKVSVIIPCYNATKWLPKCFLSLVNQTIGIKDLELIFVDDASTDDGQTWQMLQEMERAFPDSILIIQLEQNLRQGGARNFALQYATGEYLAFVDSDDFVAENYLENVYQKAKETDADLIQFEFDYYAEGLGAFPHDGNMELECLDIVSMEDRKRFLIERKMSCGCWNKLYKRSLVEMAQARFAEHVFYEEPLFVYPLFFYVKRAVLLPDKYYFYRQNEKGTMIASLREKETLRMHPDVQHQVWKFMKQTPFFQDYYEEIKLYFLHSYFYETIYFAALREFGMSMELYLELEQCVKKEVPDYDKSIYEEEIPAQMELYRLVRKGMKESELKAYMGRIRPRA